MDINVSIRPAKLIAHLARRSFIGRGHRRARGDGVLNALAGVCPPRSKHGDVGHRDLAPRGWIIQVVALGRSVRGEQEPQTGRRCYMQQSEAGDICLRGQQL